MEAVHYAYHRYPFQDEEKKTLAQMVQFSDLTSLGMRLEGGLRQNITNHVGEDDTHVLPQAAGNDLMKSLDELGAIHFPGCSILEDDLPDYGFHRKAERKQQVYAAS